MPVLSGTSKLVSVAPYVVMVALRPWALVRVKSYACWPSGILPKSVEIGMAAELETLESAAAGAEAVPPLAADSMEGVELQAASKTKLATPPAKPARKGEFMRCEKERRAIVVAQRKRCGPCCQS